MSQALIRAALEKHLTGMSQPIDTAFENATYTPKTDVPFQKVNLLPAGTTTNGHDGKTSRDGHFSGNAYVPTEQGCGSSTGAG